MRAMRKKPFRKGDQFIELVVDGVFLFIEETFLFPRLVNCAMAGLNEGEKAVGRSALSRIQTLVSRNLAKNLASLARKKTLMQMVEFQNRSQYFIRTHNKALSVAAMRVSDPDCPAVRVQG